MAYYKPNFHKPSFLDRMRQRDQLSARLERMAKTIADRSTPPTEPGSAAARQQDWGFELFFQRADEVLPEEGPKAA